MKTPPSPPQYYYRQFFGKVVEKIQTLTVSFKSRLSNHPLRGDEPPPNPKNPLQVIEIIGLLYPCDHS